MGRAGKGPFPVVLVIHENRGLNPYIEDVSRRFAVEGFLSLVPDGLAPIGGYPGNDDGRHTQCKKRFLSNKKEIPLWVLHRQKCS